MPTDDLCRAVVTGAAGKAARAIIADVVAHGYAATATDVASPPADPGAPFI